MLLYSHACSLSLSKAIDTLGWFGHAPSSLGDVPSLLKNCLAFSDTKHRHASDGALTRQAQRNHTKQLGDMEACAFPKVVQVFVIPAFHTVTLDDDLVGTRARDNQVKYLSSLKSEKEGRMADVVTDALQNVVMSVRFHCCGEPQEAGTRATIERLLEDQGHHSLSSLILTAERGYGRYSLVTFLCAEVIIS